MAAMSRQQSYFAELIRISRPQYGVAIRTGSAQLRPAAVMARLAALPRIYDGTGA